VSPVGQQAVQAPAVPRGAASSLSYRTASRRLTCHASQASYDGMDIKCIRSNVMNTVIYIVGLVVVVGFILSFFGLG
jgi:hypothetical protein